MSTGTRPPYSSFLKIWSASRPGLAAMVGMIPSTGSFRKASIFDGAYRDVQVLQQEHQHDGQEHPQMQPTSRFSRLLGDGVSLGNGGLTTLTKETTEEIFSLASSYCLFRTYRVLLHAQFPNDAGQVHFPTDPPSFACTVACAGPRQTSGWLGVYFPGAAFPCLSASWLAQAAPSPLFALSREILLERSSERFSSTRSSWPPGPPASCGPACFSVRGRSPCTLLRPRLLRRWP